MFKTDTIAWRYGNITFPRNDQVIGKALKTYGEWAQKEIDLLLKLLEPGQTAVLGGANIGVQAIAVAQRIGNRGDVVAVEVHPEMYRILKKNINENKIRNVITAHAGLSDKSGSVFIPEFNEEHEFNFGRFSLLHNFENKEGKIVKLKTIDSFALQKCNLIHLDTEGSEISILKGAKQTIQNLRPIVYVEINSFDEGFHIYQYLKECNYKLFFHSPLAFNQDNFFNNKEYDIFGVARENALLGIPDESSSNFLKILAIEKDTTAINQISDLAKCILELPYFITKIHWANTLKEFDETKQISLFMQMGANRQTGIFKLPNKIYPKIIRFTPANRNGVIKVYNLSIIQVRKNGTDTLLDCRDTNQIFEQSILSNIKCVNRGLGGLMLAPENDSHLIFKLPKYSRRSQGFIQINVDLSWPHEFGSHLHVPVLPNDFVSTTEHNLKSEILSDIIPKLSKLENEISADHFDKYNERLLTQIHDLFTGQDEINRNFAALKSDYQLGIKGLKDVNQKVSIQVENKVSELQKNLFTGQDEINRNFTALKSDYQLGIKGLKDVSQKVSIQVENKVSELQKNLFTGQDEINRNFTALKSDYQLGIKGLKDVSQKVSIQVENKVSELQNDLTTLKYQLDRKSETISKTLGVAQKNKEDLERLIISHNDLLENISEIAGQVYYLYNWRQNTLFAKIKNLLQKNFKKFSGLFENISAFYRIIKYSPLIKKSELFDTKYYLCQNPDVKKSGINPIRHYIRHGGFEGRNPSLRFNSRYYLSQNPDVYQSGLNPLVHYLVYGRSEGRSISPLSPKNNDLKVEEFTRTFQINDWPKKDPPHRIEDSHKAADKLKNTLNFDQCVLALSHDNYLESVGGVQICISDIEDKLLENKIGHIHLYPTNPLHTLADNEKEFLISVNVNSSPYGYYYFSDLLEILRHLSRNQDLQFKSLQIHHLLGWNLKSASKIIDTIKATEHVFWLHDYFSICPQYNLLRNDKQFCHAPPIDSTACLICNHGSIRKKVLPQFSEFLSKNDFTIVAPSQIAMDIWRTHFRHISRNKQRISPHLKLVEIKKPYRMTKRSIMSKPILAFIGHPVHRKGWTAWRKLIDKNRIDKIYKLYHIGSGSNDFRENFIPVSVTKENRDAMLNVLVKKGIDIVLLWSIWPETFSYVLYESIAAGCFVITHKDSGNIASYIRKNKNGVVLENQKELKAYLYNIETVKKALTQFRKTFLKKSYSLYKSDDSTKNIIN